jgi:mRNA guanylyltransferase
MSVALIHICISRQSPTYDRLKWKPDDENSIDFRLNLIFPPPSTKRNPYEINTRTPFLDIPTGTTFQLSVWSGSINNEENYTVWGDMYVPTEDWELIQNAQDTELVLENAIVECRWDKKVGLSGRWRFMRFRTDKEKANYISVAKNVQESIKDGVSKEELVKWAVDIKAGWRSRHPKK